MADRPIVPTDFLKHIGTPLEAYILPIIPVGATLSDTSGISDDNVGKIPGRYLPAKKAWVGFRGWSTYRATPASLKFWHLQQRETGPHAAGINTVVYIALDLDCDTVEERDMAWEAAKRTLGDTPVVRMRDGSPRVVLFYKRDEHKMGQTHLTKRWSVYLDGAGNKYAVELLGYGQQVIIEGPHAKGKMHYWYEGRSLVEYESQLPLLTGNMVEQFFNELGAMAALYGHTRETKSRSQGAMGELVGLTNLMSPHIAKDPDLLTRAMESISLDHPHYCYHKFIDLLRALAAASGGDMDFMTNKVWPWVCRSQTIARGQGPRTEDQPQGIMWLEERWRSFTDSSFGADYVYREAYEFGGFKEGLESYNGAKAEELFSGDNTQSPDDASVGGVPSGDQSGNPGAPVSGGAGQVGGPLPFQFTDEALADLFPTIHPGWRYASDQGWVRLKSGVYVPDQTILEPIGRMCSAVGDPYRAQGPQGAKVDQMLKSTKKVGEVERRLRTHAAMYAEASEFDSDPWLLNTPDFIIDLRDGAILPHGTAPMRQQTSVSPALHAMGDYEFACPRFIDFMQFIADDRATVIPFLQRWGASSFVGALFGAYFLFVHGKPGTGKSVFVDILGRLAHTYGAAASKGFFMRSLDKRTFELFQMVGKRGIFGDETPKGATWDEMLINSMTGGTEISAEGKGKAFIKFRNAATITLTGNHKPAFVTSAEESGIDRRLLLLTLNKKIKDYMRDNEQFAYEVVRDEGPAILMFFVQGAMEGWKSLQTTGSFLGGLEADFLAAAKHYRREANPHAQWVDEYMTVDAEGTVERGQALRSYRQFMLEQNPRFHESSKEFVDAIVLLGNGAIEYTRWKGGPRRDQRGFQGLRFRDDVTTGGNTSDKVVNLFPNGK
jgi:P4 family phage/plasmid primase-like protien